MTKGFRTGFFVVASLLLLSGAAHAQPSNYQGIWQDVQSPTDYYSIHVKGTQAVLIDLAGLETSGATLQSSYQGNITDSGSGFLEARMRVLEEHAGISFGAYVTPASGGDLFVSWSCSPEAETCAGDVRRLRKIF